MSAGLQSKKPSSHSEGYCELFKAAFHDLVKELTEDGLKNPEIADGVQHLQDVSMIFNNLYTWLGFCS